MYDVSWAPDGRGVHNGLMNTVTVFSKDSDYDRAAATVIFAGNGIKIWGRGTCTDDFTQSSSFGASLDGKDDITTEVPGGNEDRYLVDLEDLPNAEHSLALRDFSPCVKGHSYQLDYALVTISSRKEIDPRERLLVGSRDPFVKYEGDWSVAAGGNTLGLEGMETSDRQASMTFTFFGSTVTALANNEAQSTPVLISLNDEPPSTLVIGNIGSFFEAANLTPLADGQPHRLRIKFLQGDQSGPVPTLQLLGFMYSPAFKTLEDLDTQTRAWDPMFFAETRVNTTTSEGDSKPTNPVEEKGPSIVGPIVGGVLGFIALLALVVLFRRYRKRKVQKAALLPVIDPYIQTSEAAYSKFYPETSDGFSAPVVLANQTVPVPYTKSYGATASALVQNASPDLLSSNLDGRKGVTLAWDGPGGSYPNATGGNPLPAAALPSSSASSPGPQSSISRDSGPLPQVQGSSVDDTGTSSETPERLRGMIESLTARMNALEPPPPYLGEGGDNTPRRDS